MVWKANVKISDYKIGDIVPDAIAERWNKMYEKSPVSQVSETPSISAPVLQKVEERIKDFSEDLLDDSKRNYSNKKKRR